MELNYRDIQGLYLVVDPSGDPGELLDKVRRALEGGVDLLQVWNRWPEGTGRGVKEELVRAVLELARPREVPVLVNEEWELLKTTGLHGVHFDVIPDDFERIRREIGRDFLAGVTCENDLDVVRRADHLDMDYISFCAMFPSPSAGSCEIVRPDTVRRAREMTDLPMFLSGGITPERMDELGDLPFQGVAVISGILQSEAPDRRALTYKQKLAIRNPEHP